MSSREMIEKWIKEYIEQYGKNHDVETKWREPVVGVASAADPLYRELKSIIGPTHALPEDIVPGAKSVIVYFVPFAESIVRSIYMNRLRQWGIMLRIYRQHIIMTR